MRKWGGWRMGLVVWEWLKWLMLLTLFSLCIMYSAEVENSPSLFLGYRWLLRSHTKPCYNLSFCKKWSCPQLFSFLPPLLLIWLLSSLSAPSLVLLRPFLLFALVMCWDCLQSRRDWTQVRCLRDTQLFTWMVNNGLDAVILSSFRLKAWCYSHIQAKYFHLFLGVLSDCRILKSQTKRSQHFILNQRS